VSVSQIDVEQNTAVLLSGTKQTFDGRDRGVQGFRWARVATVKITARQ
jgi:hypothetical protein